MSSSPRLPKRGTDRPTGDPRPFLPHAGTPVRASRLPPPCAPQKALPETRPRAPEATLRCVGGIPRYRPHHKAPRCSADCPNGRPACSALCGQAPCRPPTDKALPQRTRTEHGPVTDTWMVACARAHAPVCSRGGGRGGGVTEGGCLGGALTMGLAPTVGGGITVKGASNPIAKNCGKLRGNGDAVTKRPEASKSNTSAPVAQNVSASLQTWSTGITIAGGAPQYYHRIVAWTEGRWSL